MFAAWRLGAAVTPVNPALTGQEARYQIDDAGAHVVVADGASAAKLEGGGYGIVPVEDVTSPARSPEPEPVPVQAGPGTLALLIYTSGTTGRPKGVMLDHANVLATAELIVAWFEMTEETRSLLVLPLFHVNGVMVSVVSPLLAGGTTYIAERFDAATFWTTVQRARPTFFSAVPTIYALLVSQPGEQADTKNLRYVICGAAPMPRELIGEFEQRFGVPVVEGYGLSECTVVCTANPVHGVRKAGSVGLALPGVEVGVVDPAGQLLPAGQAGEVVVRGPNVMRGYLGRPAESAEVLRGGWLHTGDVGRFDDAGYLTLVDRVKDLIIRGGENIYPKEIEDVLYAHPAVLEAAVVGRPDAVFGEQPVAFVALRPGRSAVPDELIEHCLGSLARYKVPREVYLETVLPKNAIGKIAKPTLRERLRAARG
jgi:acyl-CoA synthetase (AMP-forming)/AMP-acid ligase II